MISEEEVNKWIEAHAEHEHMCVLPSPETVSTYRWLLLAAPGSEVPGGVHVWRHTDPSCPATTIRPCPQHRLRLPFLEKLEHVGNATMREPRSPG